MKMTLIGSAIAAGFFTSTLNAEPLIHAVGVDFSGAAGSATTTTDWDAILSAKGKSLKITSDGISYTLSIKPAGGSGALGNGGPNGLLGEGKGNWERSEGVTITISKVSGARFVGFTAFNIGNNASGEGASVGGKDYTDIKNGVSLVGGAAANPTFSSSQIGGSTRMRWVTFEFDTRGLHTKASPGEPPTATLIGIGGFTVILR